MPNTQRQLLGRIERLTQSKEMDKILLNGWYGGMSNVHRKVALAELEVSYLNPLNEIRKSLHFWRNYVRLLSFYELQ